MRVNSLPAPSPFLISCQNLLEEPNGKQSTWDPLNIVHVGQPPGQIVAWRWVDSTCRGQIIVWNTSFLLKERSFFWKTCSPGDNISLVSSSREDIPPICRTLVFKWLLNEWIGLFIFFLFLTCTKCGWQQLDDAVWVRVCVLNSKASHRKWWTFFVYVIILLLIISLVKTVKNKVYCINILKSFVLLLSLWISSVS